jgi:hypothetical protein
MDACGIRAIVVGGLPADLRVITFQHTSELGQPAGDVAASGLMSHGIVVAVAPSSIPGLTPRCSERRVEE